MGKLYHYVEDDTLQVYLLHCLGRKLGLSNRISQIEDIFLTGPCGEYVEVMGTEII